MSDDTATLITPGTWKAKPTYACLGYTEGGNDQVEIGFVLAEGPSQGQPIRYWGTFGESSLEITFNALRNAGWTGDDLADLSSVGQSDAQPYLVIAHEEWQGKVSARVKWVNSPSTVVMKNVMNRGETQAFAQRMRGSIMALHQKLAAKRGSGAPATGAKPATPTTSSSPTSPPGAAG